MAIEQIYGNWQTAGVPVVGTGKSTPTSDGTKPYAQLVAIVDEGGALMTGSLLGTAADTSADVTIIGLLTRIAEGVEALAP